MKLDRKSKFIQLLELTLKQWKDENSIEHPFFYDIDHERNRLLLYSDDPSSLLKAKNDLAEMMIISQIRFKGYDVYSLKGGTIY